MRVSVVNSVTNNYSKVKAYRKHSQQTPVQSKEVNFRGPLGKFLGGAAGLIGAGVAVAVCPPLIAAVPAIAGIATTSGAMAGDKLEEDLKDEKKKK